MKLTAHLSIRLRMSGVIPPVPHVISRHTQEYLHLIILQSLFCLQRSPIFDFQPTAYQCANNIIVALYYLTSVFHIQEAGDFSIMNRCDLANNNGEGKGGSTMRRVYSMHKLQQNCYQEMIIIW